MAFSGTAVFQKVSDSLVRVTGLSLAASAVGTISLFEGAGEVKLPDDFNIAPYSDVDLEEAVEVSYVRVSTISFADLIRVFKAPAPLLITFTNDDGVNATPNIEIYIRFH